MNLYENLPTVLKNTLELSFHWIFRLILASIEALIRLSIIMGRRVLHSEKFEMNEEVESLLSEKVSNLLLT